MARILGHICLSTVSSLYIPPVFFSYNNQSWPVICQSSRLPDVFLTKSLGTSHLATAALTRDAVGGESTVDPESVKEEGSVCRLRGRLQGPQVEQVDITGQLCGQTREVVALSGWRSGHACWQHVYVVN